MKKYHKIFARERLVLKKKIDLVVFLSNAFIHLLFKPPTKNKHNFVHFVCIIVLIDSFTE
jgi:hypothetical protein